MTTGDKILGHIRAVAHMDSQQWKQDAKDSSLKKNLACRKFVGTKLRNYSQLMVGKGELALLKDVAPGISTPSSEATHLRVYGKHKLYLMRLSIR